MWLRPHDRSENLRTFKKKLFKNIQHLLHKVCLARYVRRLSRESPVSNQSHTKFFVQLTIFTLFLRYEPFYGF